MSYSLQETLLEHCLCYYVSKKKVSSHVGEAVREVMGVDIVVNAQDEHMVLCSI